MAEPGLLKVIRRARRSFLVEYFSSLILLSFLVLTYINNIAVPVAFEVLVITIAIAFVLSAETVRMETTYRITKDKLIIIKGLFDQHKKNVYYHPLAFVPDLNMGQTKMDRILGIGTIYLKGGVENTFEIEKVSNPTKILQLIEDLIEENKNLQPRSTNKTN